VLIGWETGRGTGDQRPGTQEVLTDIERLESSIERGSITRTQPVGERIGRIRAKYPKVAPHYDTVLTHHEDQGKVVHRRRIDRVIDLTVVERVTKPADEALRGAYVIETTHAHLNEEQIWGLCTTLTRVENARLSPTRPQDHGPPVYLGAGLLPFGLHRIDPEESRRYQELCDHSRTALNAATQHACSPTTRESLPTSEPPPSLSQSIRRSTPLLWSGIHSGVSRQLRRIGSVPLNCSDHAALG
jgi:hypothetical protein